jgi:hypothetical protein
MELQGWIGGLSGASVVAVTKLTIYFNSSGVAIAHYGNTEA